MPSSSYNMGNIVRLSKDTLNFEDNSDIQPFVISSRYEIITKATQSKIEDLRKERSATFAAAAECVIV